jgi:hypothetical protein
MTAADILREMRAAGGRPRLVDGIVVCERIENRRLMAVFRDAVDPITELLRSEVAGVDGRS